MQTPQFITRRLIQSCKKMIIEKQTIVNRFQSIQRMGKFVHHEPDDQDTINGANFIADLMRARVAVMEGRHADIPERICKIIAPGPRTTPEEVMCALTMHRPGVSKNAHDVMSRWDRRVTLLSQIDQQNRLSEEEDMPYAFDPRVTAERILDAQRLRSAARLVVELCHQINSDCATIGHADTAPATEPSPVSEAVDDERKIALDAHARIQLLTKLGDPRARGKFKSDDVAAGIATARAAIAQSDRTIRGWENITNY